MTESEFRAVLTAAAEMCERFLTSRNEGLLRAAASHIRALTHEQCGITITEGVVVPRTALVALKRSIDPHSTDSRRYEILRDDFNGFWQHISAAQEPRK